MKSWTKLKELIKELEEVDKIIASVEIGKLEGDCGVIRFTILVKNLSEEEIDRMVEEFQETNEFVERVYEDESGGMYG